MKRLLLFAALVLFVFLSHRWYMVSGDDGAYIAQARSIREGAYRAINVPGAPIQTQYPPLFPLILYPVANQPPGNLGIIRLWSAAWSLLAVAAVFAAGRARNPKTALFAAALFAASPLFGEYATSVLPETLFIGISYAVLTRVQFSDPGRRDWFIPLGLAAAWLTKSAGAALLIAVLLWYARHRRWREMFLYSGLALLLLAPWLLWQNLHAGDYIRGHILQRDIYDPSAGAISPLGLFTERLPYNLSRYVGRITVDVLLPPFFRGVAPWTTLFPLKVGVSLALSLLVAFGFFRSIRHGGWRPEEIFVVTAGLMFLVHPVFADRYLYALLPSLIGYALLAIPRAAWIPRVAIIYGFVLLLGGALSILTPIDRREAAYVQAVEWLGEHSRPGEIVLARKPTMVWFYARRQAAGYPAGAWPPALFETADWVIRDDYTIGVHAAKRYLDPVLADTSRFSVAFTSTILPSVRIYRIHAEGKQ